MMPANSAEEPELLVQADAVLTTGHHAEVPAAGEQTDMMAIAHDRYPDLRDYRRSRGLSEHPMCVVVTSRFDFSVGALMAIGPRMDAAKRRAARKAGIEAVTVDPDSRVTGQDLLGALDGRGLRRVYMVRGRASSVDSSRTRSSTGSISPPPVGCGGDIETLVQGPALRLPPEATLRRLALDLDG